jgi:hypothetical protein
MMQSDSGYYLINKLISIKVILIEFNAVFYTLTKSINNAFFDNYRVVL